MAKLRIVEDVPSMLYLPPTHANSNEQSHLHVALFVPHAHLNTNFFTLYAHLHSYTRVRYVFAIQALKDGREYYFHLV